MKKIISFSLWGNDKNYTIGAIKNAELSSEIYPGWICRYYIGKSTNESVINDLDGLENTEVVRMDFDGDWTGMFWRFYPASENDVDIMLSRDCDSRVSVREKEAVNEWINSDKGFHIMRDHPYHNTVILGGMWGVKKNVVPQMKHMIDEYIKKDFWQIDQNFLRDKVYPLIKNNTFVHDEFFEKNPFPKKRENQRFVGEKIDIYEKPYNEDYKLIKLIV